jgi:GTP-binding protein Era
MLKRIGTYARTDIEKILNVKVNLQVWVKIKEDWQEDNNILKRFKSEGK